MGFSNNHPTISPRLETDQNQGYNAPMPKPTSGKLYDTDFIYNISEAVSYRFFGPLFTRLPFDHIQITFLGFFLNGLPAVYFFSLGTHLGYLLGILFCITYSIFDWMDGYVAKSRGIKSIM